MADGFQSSAPVADAPVEVQQSSMSEAELNALIDSELGITSPSPVVEEPVAPVEPETPIEPEAPAEEEPAAPVEEELVTPVAPTAPSDEEMFIEVEDIDGTTHKISKIEDLPDDFTPKSNRATIELLRELDRLDARIAERDANNVKAAEAAQLAEIQTNQFKSWDTEIAELAKEKRITATDTEKIDAVFTHMNEINQARIKAGNQNLVSSFEDALEKYEAKIGRDAAETAKQNDNDKAKAKAALIGGASAPAGEARQPYRSGQYRNIDDIPL